MVYVKKRGKGSKATQQHVGCCVVLSKHVGLDTTFWILIFLSGLDDCKCGSNVLFHISGIIIRDVLAKILS